MSGMTGGFASGAPAYLKSARGKSDKFSDGCGDKSFLVMEKYCGVKILVFHRRNYYLHKVAG
jgi:hypothetical protein